MIQLLTAGLALGILGSFHCIGMCGPLAIVLPVRHFNSYNKFLGTLLYNAGRIFTYAVLGLIFGLMGRSIALLGFQQLLSITIGIMIVVILFFGSRFKKAEFHSPYINSFFNAVRIQLSKLYNKRSFSAIFFIGILNGLLPCGLVYMAIAGAVATGNITESIIFMASFGLGTLPVMWAIAFWGSLVAVRLRVKVRKLYPFIMLVMACLLIMRGLGLGIPYLSPKIINQKNAIEECKSQN